jgi:glycosyltransferase involved in cell wall biosynthesis
MKTSDRRTVIHVPRRFVEHEWGGTESVLANLVRGQSAAGWRPEIFTSLALSDRPRDSFAGVPVKRFRYCYPFFGLSARQRQAMDKKGGNLLSWSLLGALLRAPGVRIFHAHAAKRLGGTVRTAARLRGRPYVITLHGGIFDVPAEELSQLVENQAGKIEWGRLAGALLGSRRVLLDADAVICVGRLEAEKARQALGHDRVHHLPNGVDCARFARGDRAAFRAAHSLPADARVVLCVSRIDPQKDQRLLVEAFDRLAADDARLHLVLAGPATAPDYLAALDRRIAASPHAHRVRRLGALAPDGADLPNAFHAADVFALASRHEPFGIVALEAWSAGLPVVAGSVGGLRDLIVPEKTGLLFGAGDVDDCARAIGRMLANPGLAAACATAGRTLARECYAWPRVTAALEQIYQAAEARPHRAPGTARAAATA